jgi:hypothetical protein
VRFGLAAPAGAVRDTFEMIFVLFSFSLSIAAAAFRSIDLGSSLSGEVGFKMLGHTTNTYTARVANAAGDFNDDGIADLMLSASKEPNLYSDSTAGVIYFIFGKSGSSSFSTIDLATFTTSNTNGFHIYGGNVADELSTSAGLGDFNGDGIDDIAVGAQLANPSSRTDAGIVYVIYGRTSVADIDLRTFSASSTNGFMIYGQQQFDSFGNSLMPIGDFNGDGRKDLLALCNNNGVRATAYVIFGTNTRTTDLDLASLTANTDGFRITATPDSSRIYYVGDVNNDGFDDAGVGNYGGTYSGRSSSGIVYLIFGHSTGTAFPDLTLSSMTSGAGAVRILGATASAMLGFGGGSGGDFNHDGLHDFMIGTVNSVYVIFGQSGVATYSDIDLSTYLTSNTDAGQLFSTASGGGYPWYMGSPGDIDGDGITDVFISVPGYSTSGICYVVSGHTTGFADVTLTDSLTAGLALRIVGAAGDGLGFGTAVEGADYNNDGAPDLLIGASYAASNGITGSGAAYVLYGALAAKPSSQPSSRPSAQPSVQPSSQPSAPTSKPSTQPSSQPSGHPSSQPSSEPSGHPSCQPSSQPSRQPSSQPSGHPSIQPSGKPSAQPASCPTSRPSSQPSRQPSSQPSTQPSINLPTAQLIQSSPTYKVRNGFAFAAIGAGGKAEAWGEALYGGDAFAVQSELNANVAEVVASRFSFAAITADGSLGLWGVNASAAGLLRYGSLSYALTGLVANEAAFAGVDSATGRVIAVGSKHHGGNVLDDAYCNGYSLELSAGVRAITASSGAFAAIKTDNTLVCWGNKHAGADVASGVFSALAGAEVVVATMAAFAVLLSDGSVVSWGDRWSGGDSTTVSSQLRDVHHLTASRSSFVAFKKDSGVVVWGYGKYGGDTSAVAAALSSHVTQVAHTFTAMAALKTDGTVVAWGKQAAGGDASVVQSDLHDVVSVTGNSRSFAALTSAGGVVTWGSACCGGSIPSEKVTALSSGVASIHHTDRAFAALKSDGSVVTWGQAAEGGSPGAAVEALLTSGVHTICANDVAFSAIKTDGKVVAWGHSASVPTAGVHFTSSSLAPSAQCA